MGMEMKMNLQERLKQLLDTKDVKEKDDLIALMLLDIQSLFDEVTKDNLVKITIDKNYTSKIEATGALNPEIIAGITMQLANSCYQLLGALAQHAIPNDNIFKKLLLITYLQDLIPRIYKDEDEEEEEEDE